MADIRIVRWALLGALGLTAALSAPAAMAQQTGPSERSTAQEAPYQYREGGQPRADRETDDSDEDDDTDMDQSSDRGDLRPGQQERADRQGWRERDDGRERERWRDRDRGERFGRDGDRDRPRRPMMGHAEMMRHHGMMMGMMRLCGPNGAGMADRMLDRLETLTNPMEAQREAFQQLKDAASKAVEIARAGCTSERAITPPGRLAAAEKRLESLLQAVKTVRPAMDAFYGMLNDEQKARLYIAQSWPRRMGGWHQGRDQDRGFDDRRFDDRRGGWRERANDRPYARPRDDREGWRNEDSRGGPNWREGERERGGDERPRRGPRDDDDHNSRSGDWRGQL